MRYFIILLALVALGVCAPNVKQRAADQDLLNKQQDVIQLLQKISQPIPNQELQNLGASYDIESNSHQYKNPIIVMYYAGAVKAGLVQPQGTTFSNSISQLRKEVSLLYRILLGAKDYQTFLKTAAWARVHVNEGQFLKAFVAAVLTRQDTQSVIFPPVYEILPQHHLDSRVIQEAQNIAIQNTQGKNNQQNILIPVNYSALLSHDEQQLSYFTQDIGLAAYYAQVNLAGYIQEQNQQQQQQPLTQQQYQQQIVGKYLQQQAGQQDQQANIGRGAQYLYLHQQLLARYELNRLSNGLGPIKDIDYENVQSLYQPHLRGLNGLEFAGRPQNLQLQSQRNQLIQYVATLEKRLRDAIDSGNVITPQGVFLSLYQPQGMNILGDLIEGTGRSVNPKYYGSLQAAARKLLGNAPEVENIWDYTPSSLELGEVAVHDPVFYQLYKKVMNLYQQYQQSLPVYQYNDLILPGVTIQNVDVSQLVTLFTDFYVDLDAVTGHQSQQQQEEQTQSRVRAHLKRLDHQPYQYKIAVHSEQNVPGAVVRVFLGPKHDHQGRPISISKNQHLFVELDQFIQNLHAGENTIIRNSQQAPGQSPDWPSTSQIQRGVNAAIRSQEPFYITEPHQIFSFPARLSLPKGQPQGFPLQFLVVISSSNPLNVPYGPVIPEQSLTYQDQQYQVVSVDQYQQLKEQGQISQVGGGIQQNVEVLPENLVNAQQQVQAVRNYYANLYTKYHGQYPNTQIQNPVGQGQDMTYSVQGVGVVNAGGWLGQQGNSWSQQQVQQAQQVQQQMQAAMAAVQQSQQRHQHAAQMIYGHQQSHHGLHINSSPSSVQSGQQQQSVLQGLGVQGVQQGVQGVQTPQGVQGVQGLLQGVQQVFGQGVQGMNVPYGMQRGQSGGQTWSNSQVQGVAVPGSGIVASGQQHAGGWQSIYAQPQTVQDQIVSEYYQNKPISEVIGGAISLDGKPLGFPLDRPLSLGALSVPNIFVKDVLVFHQGQPTNDITQ